MNRGAVYVIFFLSGAAALVYQVCWQRLMSVYYGVGSVSIAVVVSAFMLGLGIGALLGGWIAERARRPLLVYAGVEAGIGVFGLASLAILTHIGSATAGSSYALTFLYSFAFLLLPTALMGMTLPIAIAILQRSDASVLRDTSGYYFSNTLGAAFGALACGYVLLSLIGIDGAVYTAVVINVLLAVALFLLVKGRALAATDAASGAALLPAPVWRPILVLLFVNGFFAIGYQIVWYRLLVVLLKDSAYAFSTILAVYLLGVGLGSLWLYRRGLPRLAGRQFAGYLWLNAAVGIASFAAILLVFWLGSHQPLSNLIAFSHTFDLLPWIGDPSEWRGGDAYFATIATLAVMLFWPIALMLVPTWLMGASFPVGIALAAGDGPRAARGASIGYAMTIAGNALGGLVTQFVLLPAVGTTLVIAGFCAAQVAFLWFARPAGMAGRWRLVLRIAPLAGAAAVIAAAPTSAELYRRIHKPPPSAARAHFAEGLEGVGMVYEDGHTLQNFINGTAHGTRPGGDFVYQALVALSHVEAPRDVLVIGYGAGGLVDALRADQRVRRITVVELHKTAFDNLMKVPYVARELADPRVELVFDDGRRYLQRSGRKFDLISMVPIRSRAAYSNNLYSADFFRLTHAALNPGGVIAVWCGDDWVGGVKKAIATVYPEVTLFRYFVVASTGNTTFSPDSYQVLLAGLSPAVASDVKLFQGRASAGREAILKRTSQAPLNTDLRPYSEYFLGGLVWRN